VRKGKSNAASRAAAHNTNTHKREDLSAAGDSKMKQWQYQTVLIACFRLIL